MTRTAKALISTLTVVAVSVGLGPSAMAYYSTGTTNPSGDDRSSATAQTATGSPNAILGEQGQPSALATPGSPNAILGDQGQPGAQPVVADLEPKVVAQGDGFDWGDALVGAGVALCLALMTTVGLRALRRRTRFEPSGTRLEPSA
jgi:hypothetical protein